MNDVEVASAGIDDPGWLRRCKRFAAKVLDTRGIDNWELSILLTDDGTIRQLNRHYREMDGPTDVLSFPLHEPREILLTGMAVRQGLEAPERQFQKPILDSGDLFILNVR